jgi:putative transposase
MEDLTVRNMLKNRHLSRAITDAAWRELRGMLEYKAHWYGRDVNAAKNLLAAGLAVSACGAGVRPQRDTPGGRSAAKQEPLRCEL